MTNKKNWRATLIAALTTAMICCATCASAANCSRKELADTVDAYFRALLDHNYNHLSLTRHAGFTENGVTKAFGEGFWRTAGPIKMRRSALDTETCGTASEAIVEENGKPMIFAVRLKLVHGHIAEAETLLARSKEFGFKPEGVLETSGQDWEGILPPADRTPREAMIKAANDYYDMFAMDPTASVPFATPCDRWENGTRTTKGDCSPKGLVLSHPVRRIPVVDEESGIVVAFVHFNHALPDMHMFKMKDGKVILVQAVIGARAPSTGWPADEPD